MTFNSLNVLAHFLYIVVYLRRLACQLTVSFDVGQLIDKCCLSLQAQDCLSAFSLNMRELSQCLPVSGAVRAQLAVHI